MTRAHIPSTGTRRMIGAEEVAILSTLEADWRHLTDQDSAAGRFNPARMDGALPFAFMLEQTAPGSLRTRVAGQRLHEMLQMDPRGMSFGAFFTEASRDMALRLATASFEEPAIIGLPLIASRGLGRRPVHAEALLLPMRDAQGQLRRVMGALVVSGTYGRRALRFEINTRLSFRCDPLDTVHPDRRAQTGRPAAPAPQTPQLVHETPLPRMARVAEPAPAAPRLRLVVNNVDAPALA